MIHKNSYASKHKRRVDARLSIDRSLLLLIAALLLFGLIIIYDATIILSQEIYGFAYRFVILQVGWIILGLIGFYVFSVLTIETLKKISVFLFILTLLLLFLLALFGVLPCDINFIFAPCINGANRWFYLNPPPLPGLPLIEILGFQPSELAKFSLILFLALRLEYSVKSDKKPFWDFLVLAGLVALLIILQPNLSTAVLIFMIGIVMYFASGASLMPMLVSLPAFLSLGFMFMLSSSYRRARLMTFLSLNQEENLTTGYHIKQILIALGSGGVFGLGLGQSRQKFQYLPEVFADSIFAIIGEELGFVGTVFLVFLFGALIYKGYAIARTSSDLYRKLLAVGITTWIALQFLVNVGAMTKMIPLTGIPLPLISYGGSSLVFIMMGLGVLANVSRTTSGKQKKS